MKEKLKKLYHWSNSWSGTIVIVLLVIFFLAQAFIIPSGSMKKTLLPGDALFAKKFAYGVPIPHIPWIEVPILPDFRGDGHLIDGPRPKGGDIVIFRYPLDVKKHFVKRCFGASGDEVIYDDNGFWLWHKSNEYMKSHYKGFRQRIVDGKVFVLNPYMKEHKGIHYINQNMTYFALKERASELIKLLNLGNFTGFIPYSKIKTLIDNVITTLAINGENVKPSQIDIGMGVYLQNGVIKYFKIHLPKDYFFMVGDNRDESFDSRFWGPIPYKLVVGKPWFIYMSWDSDFTIRWNRVGKTIDEIEEELREGKKPYITAGCEE
jgi:signal peptidase I